MEAAQFTHNFFDGRPIIVRSKTPAVKWVKQWIPQDVVATGGKCFLFKWVTENSLKALNEKAKEPKVPDPEPEPTSEVLFLCSYEGCGKTFIDAGALRKHSHIHGERQYICHYEGCGKKFLDSSKLKRHFLIHTGERRFVCPHEGCGKAFSLDFNLKSHMKTHSQENYHICPYPDCGKRYAHEYKLKNHISAQHEKSPINAPKYVPPPEKPVKTPKHAAGGAHASASSERPFACPFKGCDKNYIHEYKLKMHLKNTHGVEEDARTTQPYTAQNELDEANDHDPYQGKQRPNGKNSKKSRPKPSSKLPLAKIPRHKVANVSPANASVMKQWQMKEEAYEEEDSEETEEDNDEATWRYRDNNDDDDEETEYED